MQDKFGVVLLQVSASGRYKQRQKCADVASNDFQHNTRLPLTANRTENTASVPLKLMIRVISSDLHMHGESDQMKRPAIIMSTLMRSEIANVPFVDNKTGARRHTLVDSIAFLSRLQHTQSQKQTSATAALQTGASSARSFPGNGYDVEESR